MITFRYTKGRTIHKYCLASIMRAFTSKYILEAKMKNKVFKNISNWTDCHNSSAPNINFSSKRDFVHIKICRKCKFQNFCDELQIKTYFLKLSEKTCLFVKWTKFCREKVDILRKHCLAAIWIGFSNKYVLAAEAKKKTFSNI